MRTGFKTTDEYFSIMPDYLRNLLEQIRTALREAVPEAEEVISYQMPALKYKGILLYYAAYSKHIGLYPTNSGITAFKKELKEYKTGKGSVQFPVDKPLPIDLIKEIARFRYLENLDKE